MGRCRRAFTPEIATQVEEAREWIAQLGELDRAAEEIGIPRKTLELAGPAPPAPSAPTLPVRSAYQRIRTVWATVDAPLRARQVCEAMDMEIAQQHQSTRLRLQRLTDQRHPGQARAGIVHPAPAVAARRPPTSPSARHHKAVAGAS